MKKNKTTKPLAVLISDVHYSLANLELSDKAFRAAIGKAAELGVPLIDCGDLTNDKAILRGEVVNRLIETFKYAQEMGVSIYCLIGNHSLLNEKAHVHALNFLSPYATIIDTCRSFHALPYVTFIPYQHDLSEHLDLYLQVCKGLKHKIIIMHQGVKGAFMGDYIQDKSSIDPELLKDFTVFSGHYHRHQTVGTVTYIGNPFTMSFGETKDGTKGYLIINEDGSYTREYLQLRKHFVIEYFADAILDENIYLYPQEIKDNHVWVKIHGFKSDLDKISKKTVADKLFYGNLNFKLDKIYNDPLKLDKSESMTDTETLDALIDRGEEAQEQKSLLKKLWREVVGK